MSDLNLGIEVMEVIPGLQNDFGMNSVIGRRSLAIDMCKEVNVSNRV